MSWQGPFGAGWLRTRWGGTVLGRGWVCGGRLALGAWCLSLAGYGSKARGGKGKRDLVGSSSRRLLLPSLLAESPASYHLGISQGTGETGWQWLLISSLNPACLALVGFLSAPTRCLLLNMCISLVPSQGLVPLGLFWPSTGRKVCAISRYWLVETMKSSLCGQRWRLSHAKPLHTLSCFPLNSAAMYKARSECSYSGMKSWRGLVKEGQWYQHTLELGDHKYQQQHPGDACRTLILPQLMWVPQPCLHIPYMCNACGLPAGLLAAGSCALGRLQLPPNPSIWNLQAFLLMCPNSLWLACAVLKAQCLWLDTGFQLQLHQHWKKQNNYFLCP